MQGLSCEDQSCKALAQMVAVSCVVGEAALNPIRDDGSYFVAQGEKGAA
jgi:hypothetical protein